MADYAKKSEQSTDKEETRATEIIGKVIDNSLSLIPIALLILLIVFSSPDKVKQADSKEQQTMRYSVFMDKLENGEVNKVLLQDDSKTFTAVVGESEYSVPKPDTEEFTNAIYSKDIDIEYVNAENQTSVLTAVESVASLVINILFLVFLFKMVKGSFKGVSDSLSKAANSGNLDLIPTESNIKLSDVAGIDNIRDDVMSTVNLIKKRDELASCGAKTPKGVLLVGPPGVGKTLIAKAIANEAGVPFYGLCGSDFVEMYAGVGASRVRSLFKKAREQAPCVVFIDEVDSFAKKRTSSESGSGREADQTLTAFLTEADGINVTEGILIIAATNRKDVLDPAFYRPGRFDRIITVNPPVNKKDREAIINIHLKSKHLSEDFDKEFLVDISQGMSGAEIAGVINNAAIESINRNGKGIICNRDIELSLDKFLLEGNPVINDNEDENWRVSIHEAGHALIGLLTDKKVLKATCVGSSSGAGGVTVSVNKEEKSLHTKEDLQNSIALSYGGLIAEKLFFESPSTGATSDLESATNNVKVLVGLCGLDKTCLNVTMFKNGDEVMYEECDRVSSEIYQWTTKSMKKYRSVVEVIAKDICENKTVYNLNAKYGPLIEQIGKEGV